MQCSLNIIWGTEFIQYGLYGRWGSLPPFQKNCHHLASILIVGLPLLLAFNTVENIPVSSYPFILTILVELMYSCIDFTCQVVGAVKNAACRVAMFLIRLLVWATETGWGLLAALFNIHIAFRLGRAERRG